MAEVRERCPHCNADLDAGPIPGHLIEHYDYGVSRFSRAISLYDIGLDRTVNMKCPDCGQKWQPGEEIRVVVEAARRQITRPRPRPHASIKRLHPIRRRTRHIKAA